MHDPGEESGLPPQLLWLKWLVITLAGVMIVGFVLLIAMLLVRLNAPSPGLPLPDAIVAPAGEAVEAVTAGPGWYLIVTRSGLVVAYDLEGRELRRMQLPEG
ncbi:DUF6476 family protein [Pseudoroseicyclus tamaricis]|uniref:Uncharacterized protein n=1 Tax=Pseudoroseicyclus tamaricis TaxID=2705421 RepID=A0A6B2JVG4_9RHOB|nr:DUF6476 family protein [Pseudoroseicyclus tamaricis]NDV00174.1 hypothetical protein [Pseudoroseicyclus tamaricis]